LKRFTQPAVLILTILAFAATAFGQAALTKPSSETAVNQAVLTALANLPEADTLIYINPQRILNEAAPKFMTEKDLSEMRKAFDELRTNVGFDPSKVEYVVIAVRFRKPSGDLSFNPPELMAVAGGDFSADSLLGLAKMAGGTKLREEKYGTKTLSLMTIDPIAEEAMKNPILKSYSEVGAVALNATTIAVGSPGYLKAAVDAGEGNGRITMQSLNWLLRDPNALISAAGSPWSAFAKSFGMRGTEAADRPPRCESQLGDFYGAVTMEGMSFLLRASMHADNPDTAKIMRNMLSGLLAQASSIPDPATQSALKRVSLTAEESEVVLKADVPQQMVIDFIKSQTAPKKAEPATSAPPAKKKTTPVRRRRRTT
jgi:hypothetical protein